MKVQKGLLLALACSTLAHAQDFYEAPPPANGAFIRVLNASVATLGGKVITTSNGAATPYIIVPQGDVTATVGGISSKLRVEAGKFYSVVSQGTALTLIMDQATENMAKALLTLYNLSSSATVDLKTADGRSAIVNAVRPGTSGSRTVNGITVDLTAFDGKNVLGTIKGVKLQSGNAYALVVTDSGLTITTNSIKVK